MARASFLSSACYKPVLRRMGCAGSACAISDLIPQHPVLTEEHPLCPINPYGESKFFVERMLQASAAAYGLRWISLRYFRSDPPAPRADRRTSSLSYQSVWREQVFCRAHVTSQCCGVWAALDQPALFPI